MRLIDTDLNHPFLVTATDEAIALARGRDLIPDTLHFYRRDPPGVSIGYFGKVSDDVDLEACREEGVVVVRRTSGGGTIFTNRDQLIYGLVTEKRIGATVEDSFRVVCSCIIDALGMFGVEAEYKPPNDVTVNGKKISGSAQSIKDNVNLMHGTVILDLDLELMGRVLKEKKPGYVSSVRAETGVVIDVGELKSALAGALGKRLAEEVLPGTLTVEENDLIRELIFSKYGNDEWNLKR